jgi:hypothetical protein
MTSRRRSSSELAAPPPSGRGGAAAAAAAASIAAPVPAIVAGTPAGAGAGGIGAGAGAGGMVGSSTAAEAPVAAVPESSAAPGSPGDCGGHSAPGRSGGSSHGAENRAAVTRCGAGDLPPGRMKSLVKRTLTAVSLQALCRVDSGVNIRCKTSGEITLGSVRRNYLYGPRSESAQFFVNLHDFVMLSQCHICISGKFDEETL